jgi:septal ring factor EnvC (AmiA/AmiB activator)
MGKMEWQCAMRVGLAVFLTYGMARAGHASRQSDSPTCLQYRAQLRTARSFRDAAFQQLRSAQSQLARAEVNARAALAELQRARTDSARRSAESRLRSAENQVRTWQNTVDSTQRRVDAGDREIGRIEERLAVHGCR